MTQQGTAVSAQHNTCCACVGEHLRCHKPQQVTAVDAQRISRLLRCRLSVSPFQYDMSTLIQHDIAGGVQYRAGLQELFYADDESRDMQGLQQSMYS